MHWDNNMGVALNPSMDPFVREVLELAEGRIPAVDLSHLNIITTGSARHGKDTVSELLVHLANCTYISSSYIAMDAFLYDDIKDVYGYPDMEACYADRVTKRKLWFDKIVEFNADDKARLGKCIFARSNIYCGLRNVDELIEMRRQNVVDVTIWVDAGARKPPESKDSLTITRGDCDYVIDNSRENDPHHLLQQVMGLIHTLSAWRRRPTL